jgi:dipeptidyl-peptidase 4
MRLRPFLRPWQLTTLVAVLAPLHSAAAQQVARSDSAARLTIDRIFRRGDFDPDPAPTIRWMQDGQSYVDLRSATGGGSDIVRVDLPTGDTTVLIAAAQIVGADGKRLEIEDVALSSDETKALIAHDSRPLLPHKDGGFYHVVDLRTKRLTPLSRGPLPLQHAKLSPDGRRAAFVRDNDLWLVDLSSGAERRLTRDGSETILNGISDWVYDEEFDIEDAWRWSPDSKRIAWIRFDQSRTPKDPLVRDTAVYPTVTFYRHAKPGQPNSRVRVGVVDVATGASRWLDIGADTSSYIPRLGWLGVDSVVVQRLPRRQNRIDVLMLSAATGRGRTVITERDSAYVDVQDQPVWIDGGRRFLWSSDRSGWRQIYLYERSGTLVRQITADGMDVVDIEGVDQAGRGVYVQVAAPDPTQKQIMRFNLDAAGPGTRVTETPGTHALDIGPGARWGVETYSRIHGPPTITAMSLAGTTARRVLVENARVKGNLARLDVRPPEFFRIPMPDGTVRDAYRIVPSSFDSTRKYPVLLYIYGGPANPTVTDAWGDNRYHFHHLLAQQGYIVVSVDPRGAAWRGRDFRKATQYRLGFLESEDILNAIRWLGSRAWVDASRIGMWGRSYGGFMTALVAGRAGTLLKVAMPVVLVADWRLYDSIYTERYMWLPDENPEGYRLTAPLTYVDGISARLLISWSTGDDNVHPTNTVQYVDRLVAAGKPFEMVLYPGRPHPLPGKPTRAHWYGSMMRFVLEHL